MRRINVIERPMTINKYLNPNITHTDFWSLANEIDPNKEFWGLEHSYGNLIEGEIKC